MDLEDRLGGPQVGAENGGETAGCPGRGATLRLEEQDTWTRRSGGRGARRGRREGLKAVILRAGAREAAEARPQPLPHQPEEIRCWAVLGEERGVQVKPCVS